METNQESWTVRVTLRCVMVVAPLLARAPLFWGLCLTLSSALAVSCPPPPLFPPGVI